MEATADAFAKQADILTGTVEFVEAKSQPVRKTKSPTILEGDNDLYCVCKASIEMERDLAIPFKPTVVVKEVPKGKIVWLSIRRLSYLKVIQIAPI